MLGLRQIKMIFAQVFLIMKDWNKEVMSEDSA